MIEAARQDQLQKPQHPRVRVKRPDTAAPDPRFVQATPDDKVANAGEAGDFPQGEFTPAKKRRRRRKPVSRGEGGNEGGPLAGNAASDV